MPCVGSSSFISSSLCAEPRFPEACLSGFVCNGFPHACLALRVVIESDDVSDSQEVFDWPFGLDVEDKLLLEYDDSLDTTRSTKLFIYTSNCLPIFGRSWSFAVFHSYEHPCSEQSLPSDRTACVSSSNCTVTNRSRSWTYTCASSFVCTSPLAVTTVVGVLDLRKVSIASELKSFLLSMCIEAPESTTNIRSAVFLETSTGASISTGESNVALSSALSWKFFLAKSHAALRAHSSCLEVSSGVLSPNLGAQGFRSWVSPFWITPRDGPCLSRIWISHQVRPENLIACPAEACNLVCPTFRRIDFFGSEFWDTQPLDLFFFQNRNCSLSTLTLRPLAGFLLHQHVDTGNYCHEWMHLFPDL